MLAEIGCIAIGVPIGFALRKNTRAVCIVNRLTMWAIYGLLFLLGLSLGTNATVMSQIDTIGIQALLISICTVTGSACATWLLDRYVLKGCLDER